MGNQYVAQRVQLVEVADITDPSAELNELSSSEKGGIAVVYDTSAGNDAMTLYAWDDASSESENVPYSVDGAEGMWLAIAGEYNYFDPASLPMDIVTDPPTNTIATTAKVDTYSGVIVTLTTSGNSQTMSSPTETTPGRRFTVVNHSTSTDTIEVAGIVIEPLFAQCFMWDGAVWIPVTSVDAEDITYNPAAEWLTSTNVQDALDELAGKEPLVSHDVGGAGSVSVVDDVESASIALELFGSPFRNDILKGNATFEGVSGDVYLYRINTAGTITYEMFTSSTTGANTPTANTESVFDMTKLGVYNTDQVLAMASLGVVVTTSTRIDALSTGDAGTVMPTLQPDYVYGLASSEVHSAVNRGNNFFFGDLLYDAGSNGGGVIVNSPTDFRFDNDSASTYVLPRLVLKVAKGEQYTIGLSVEDFESNGGVNTIYMDGQSAACSDGDKSITFTASDNEVVFYIDTPTSNTSSAHIYDIQLNQGSTALPYKTPLDSGFLAGSLSENQLRNGNGEFGVDGWEDSVANTGFEHDGTEFIITHEANAAASEQTAVLNSFEGTLYANLTAIPSAKAIEMQVYVYEQNDSDVDLVADGWTWDGANDRYYKAYTSATEFVAYFNAIKYIKFYSTSTTITDEAKFKKVQLYKGSYTLAEMQAKPYVSFSPLLLLNSGNGTTNVSDSLEQVGPNVMLNRKVETVEGFVLGDDEIDDTALNTNTVTNSGNTSFDYDNFSGASATGFTADTVSANGAYVNLQLIANFVASKHYRIYYNLVINAGTAPYVKEVTGSPDLGQLSAGTGLYLDFVTTDAFSELYLAHKAGETADFIISNISVQAYNIWQNTSQEPINLTETGVAITSLIQVAHEGPNYIVMLGNMLAIFTYETGFQAVANDVRTNKQEIQALQQKSFLPQFLSLTPTSDLIDTDGATYEFKDNPVIRDFFKNIDVVEFAKHGNVTDVIFFPNSVVVITNSTGVTGGQEAFHGTLTPAEAPSYWEV